MGAEVLAGLPGAPGGFQADIGAAGVCAERFGIRAVLSEGSAPPPKAGGLRTGGARTFSFPARAEERRPSELAQCLKTPTPPEETVEAQMTEELEQLRLRRDLALISRYFEEMQLGPGGTGAALTEQRGRRRGRNSQAGRFALLLRLRALSALRRKTGGAGSSQGGAVPCVIDEDGRLSCILPEAPAFSPKPGRPQR